MISILKPAVQHSWIAVLHLVDLLEDHLVESFGSPANFIGAPQ